MTDAISDFLNAVVVAIIPTIAIAVVFVLSGANIEAEQLLELPFYQLIFIAWLLIVIIIFWSMRRNETKMYG